MTIRGIGYLGLLALTLFLAFATGIREIFWIVLFLTLLLALAARLPPLYQVIDIPPHRHH